MPSHKIRKAKPQKVYVKVNSDFDATGYVQPRTIIWRDGRSFKIEAVKDFRPSSMFTNMVGDCYTVIINGQEKHLFFERTDPLFTGRLGRWFVEVTE